MKKASAEKLNDELRPEYDLSKLKGGVRGKYYGQAVAGTNLMLIEPDLAKVFGDADAVNRALRLLVDTAAAAAGPTRRRQDVPGLVKWFAIQPWQDDLLTGREPRGRVPKICAQL